MNDRPNTVQFQYTEGDAFVMRLYRVKGIERLNGREKDEISFAVKFAEEPRNSNNEKSMQVPNIFMLDLINAFQNDDFVLVSENSGVAEAVIVISKPYRFSLTEYINNKSSD